MTKMILVTFVFLIMIFSVAANEDVNYGMMNMMMKGGMMRMSYGMMGSGYGMMGSTGYWNFYNILYVLLLLGLVAVVWLLVWKLWSGMNVKGKKR